MPYLKDMVTELQGLITEAKDMDTKQQNLRGSLQETVRQRKILEKQGGSLHLRVGSMLKGNLGFDNQTLLGFGLKPRRPRRKKTPETAPSPEAAKQP
jgi:hypothetical protein